MKRIAALISAVLVTAAAGGCSWRETAPDKAQESVQVFAMDTAMVITAYGEEATRGGLCRGGGDLPAGQPSLPHQFRQRDQYFK